MNWILLMLAGIFEVGFAFSLGKIKVNTGAIYNLWFAGFIISLSLSMILLYKATQTLFIGTAYGVWTGIGAVGKVLLGILVFREPAHFWRLFFLEYPNYFFGRFKICF